MARLFLVRHAQASLLADDYDRLSPLGDDQSTELGRWFVRAGIAFDFAVSGTLARQSRTARFCLDAMDSQADLSTDAGLDEYGHHELFPGDDPLASHAGIIAHVRDQPNPRAAFQQLISDAFEGWLRGDAAEKRERSWATFRAGAVGAIERAAAACGSGGNALVVSSGGCITAICQHLLGIPDDRIAPLHWVVRNASVTQLLTSPGRVTLSSFNSVAHFEGHPESKRLVTYR